MIRVVFMLAQEKPTKSAQLLTRAMLTLNTFGPIAGFFFRASVTTRFFHQIEGMYSMMRVCCCHHSWTFLGAETCTCGASAKALAWLTSPVKCTLFIYTCIFYYLFLWLHTANTNRLNKLWKNLKSGLWGRSWTHCDSQRGEFCPNCKQSWTMMTVMCWSTTGAHSVKGSFRQNAPQRATETLFLLVTIKVYNSFLWATISHMTDPALIDLFHSE